MLKQILSFEAERILNWDVGVCMVVAVACVAPEARRLWRRRSAS